MAANLQSITTNTKCYPSRLKRIFRSSINYRTYDSFIPNMQRAIVGNIPSEIINLFPKSNRAEKIKQVQEIFSQISCLIRRHRNFMKNDKPKMFSFDYYSKENVEAFENVMTVLIDKMMGDVLPEGYKTELKYVKSGGFANVFKLSIKDQNDKKIMHDKALKVYYNIEEPLLTNKAFHNNYAEANIWTYLKYFIGHNMDKTQFTKHYISDMKSGYCITEFIDDEIHPVTSKFSFKKILKIIYGDLKNNKPINKKLYDAGGIYKDTDFIEDPIVQKYYKKLYNRNSKKDLQIYLDILEKRIQNPKYPFRDKIIRAIEIFQSKPKTFKPKNKKFNIFRTIKNLFKHNKNVN